MPTFGLQLSSARTRAGLAQAELAHAIGVSGATVASWEGGRRHPASRFRSQLIEAGDVLGLTTAELNDLLIAGALQPVPDSRTRPILDRRKPIAVLKEECGSYPWPTLAMNEDFEIVAWNSAANDLSELDIGEDLAEPGARQLLRMAISGHYRGKLQKWDEVISVMVGIWKNGGFDPLSPDARTPYFENLMAYLVANHGGDLGRLLHIWETAPVHLEGERLQFDAPWLTSDGTHLKFHCQLTSWSEFDLISAFDWHPADAATWTWLARQRAKRELSPSNAPERREATPSSARHLLRHAREQNGLARARLARLSGFSENFIYLLESGRKPLLRESILTLAKAMTLNTASLNAILDAAGFEPENTDYWAYLFGYDVSASRRYAFSAEERRSWTPGSIAHELSTLAWPALVVNQWCEVLAANKPLAALFGLDLQSYEPGPERNLFALVTHPNFIAGAKEWDAAVSHVLPGKLEHYMGPWRGLPEPEQDSTYFEAVVAFVQRRERAEGRGDTIIRRALAAWARRPRRQPEARIVFRLEWLANGKALAFNTVISPWNGMFDPYWAIELHPADAATWNALAELLVHQ